MEVEISPRYPLHVIAAGLLTVGALTQADAAATAASNPAYRAVTIGVPNILYTVTGLTDEGVGFGVAQNNTTDTVSPFEWSHGHVRLLPNYPGAEVDSIAVGGDTVAGWVGVGKDSSWSKIPLVATFTGASFSGWTALPATDGQSWSSSTTRRSGMATAVGPTGVIAGNETFGHANPVGVAWVPSGLGYSAVALPQKTRLPVTAEAVDATGDVLGSEFTKVHWHPMIWMRVKSGYAAPYELACQNKHVTATASAVFSPAQVPNAPRTVEIGGECGNNATIWTLRLKGGGKVAHSSFRSLARISGVSSNTVGAFTSDGTAVGSGWDTRPEAGGIAELWTHPGYHPINLSAIADLERGEYVSILGTTIGGDILVSESAEGSTQVWAGVLSAAP